MPDRDVEADRRPVRAGPSGPGFLRPLIHDLRSPLMAARNVIESLRTGDLTEEQRDELLADVVDCLTAIDEAAMRVFALERLEEELAAEPAAELDVGDAVAEAVFDADLPVPVKLDIGPGPHNLIGHRGALTQAVHHLLRNAVDHTPTGTSIEVHVSTGRRAVHIAVEDEGPGVPERLRERIFAPFERGEAEARRGGLGLGLALVARAAEVHGGRAWVEDRPGGGASFRMALPRRTRGRRATDVTGS